MEWPVKTSMLQIDVLVENGVFTTTFSVPETSGTIFDAELQIWDPIESERFLTTAFPNVIIDGDEPVLLTANVDQLSRFDLNRVDIGANIEEPQVWTNVLSMTCQVTSTTIDWEPITLEREPIDVFDGRTLFSFRFNFSSSGQPSLLGSQAYLIVGLQESICWVGTCRTRHQFTRKPMGIYSIDRRWP